MSRPNVLLIVLDSVRADRLPPSSSRQNITPNIESVSKESTIFENAMTVAPSTLPSHAAMFTGLYSSEHGALNLEQRKIRSDIKTLAEILSDVGYETAAVCQNDWVSLGKTTGLERGFETFYGPNEIISTSIHSKLSKINRLKTLLNIYATLILNRHLTELSVSLIKQILKKSVKNQYPVFVFVNLMNAHYPYEDGVPSARSLQRLLEKVRNSPRPRVSIERQIKQLATKNEFTEQEFAELRERYDDSIQFMDKQLGDLFQFMRRDQIMDETLMIVTADHGEDIGDHGWLGHGFYAHESLIRVPLIIRYPRLVPSNRIISRQVENRRIFHTILDVVLGSCVRCLRNDPSLLKELQDVDDDDYAYGEYCCLSPRERTVLQKYGAHFEDDDINDLSRFVTRKGFKLIEHGKGLRAFYSIEDEDTCIKRSDNVEAYDDLSNRLDAWKSELHLSVHAEADKAASDETVLTERLRALGYI